MGFAVPRLGREMYDIGVLLGRHEVGMNEGRGRPKETLFLVCYYKWKRLERMCFILGKNGKGKGVLQQKGILMFLFSLPDFAFHQRTKTRFLSPPSIFLAFPFLPSFLRCDGSCGFCMYSVLFYVSVRQGFVLFVHILVFLLSRLLA